MKIKGVNLGNWLVLEKWMSPFLFEGTDAQDEYYLPRRLSPGVYAARLFVHRNEYITERDFAAMRRIGLNAVRIPVPYFIFGDREPFVGCIEYLDRAFDWAEKYSLRILIDLHTAPGSQNGFDNGGICGVVKWAQSPEEVEFVLRVLEKLAARYGTRKGLYGIQPLNEPLTEELWDTFDVQRRYPPLDPEMARGSAPISLSFLRGFYKEAYRRIRGHMKADKAVVLHDGFQIKAWREFLADPELENIVLDTHQYLMVAEMMGCERDLDGYLAYIKEHFEKDIAEVGRYADIICGEWCLFNSYACGVDTRGGKSVLSGMDFSERREAPGTEEKRRVYRELARAQIAA